MSAFICGNCGWDADTEDVAAYPEGVERSCPKCHLRFCVLCIGQHEKECDGRCGRCGTMLKRTVGLLLPDNETSRPAKELDSAVQAMYAQIRRATKR
jgi:hypothetical protein